MKTLYPMDMEEFMLACGKKDFVDKIKTCFATDTSLPVVLHNPVMGLYPQYLVVGGMPECVLQFVEAKDYILVRHTQNTILDSFPRRIQGFNTDILKTAAGLRSLRMQSNGFLCQESIVSQVYKAEQARKPLENYWDIDAFKIYVSDLVLLCAKKGLAANGILYMVDEINYFEGGMTENYVNVQLSINGYQTYYWESERGREIDFII